MLDLPSVFSRFVEVVRRNPLVSATALCMVLTGLTAGVVNWSYNWDMVSRDYILLQYASGKSGVSLAFGVTRPNLV